ncbi:MAG: sterol desaturase family protein [Sphingobacteriales bacterium]|nr:sterol desaturase family protein [Sphingobacteriales bacterium]
MITSIKKRLRHWWEVDWNISRPSAHFYLLVVVIAFGYTFMELFLKIGNPGLKIGISDFIRLLQGQISYEAPAIVKQLFPYMWIAGVLSCYIFRVYLIISSYFISMRMFDRQKFQRDFLVYIFSVVLVVAATVLLFRIIGLIYWLSGNGFHNGVMVMENMADRFQYFIYNNIPTLVELPYPVALLTIFLGLTVSSLGGYFIHWLTHQSRLLWLTVHRPHHMPEILHPVGIPLAFNFDFILIIPGLLFNVLFTKLFYEGSLILETTLILIFYYHFEIFNHLSTHYHTAYHNRFVRFFSDLTGSGIYHYVHHTSEVGKETVNLGGGIYLLWDRIFGTFEQPQPTPPNTGLSGNPSILMNPFRVTFSGFAQIWFELKHNHSLKTRWLILFGNVFYKPPVSKEYLILGYPDK